MSYQELPLHLEDFALFRASDPARGMDPEKVGCEYNQHDTGGHLEAVNKMLPASVR